MVIKYCKRTSSQAELKLTHSRVEECSTDPIYFLSHFCNMLHAYYLFGIYLHCSAGKNKTGWGQNQEEDKLLLGTKDTRNGG